MKIHRSIYCDPDVCSLWDRMSGEIEMLLNGGWEIVAVSTTASAYGDHRYNGVIFYTRKP